MHLYTTNNRRHGCDWQTELDVENEGDAAVPDPLGLNSIDLRTITEVQREEGSSSLHMYI
jgi:hypothetical protein